MKALLHLLLAGTALGICATSARATSVGVDSDPAGLLWDRNSAGTAFAAWDTFPAITYGNDAPDASFGTRNTSGTGTAVLSQTAVFTNFGAGAGLYTTSSGTAAPANGPGDVLFAGGNTINFVAEGQVTFTIRGIYLQIKRPSTSNAAASNALADQLLPVLKINNGDTFSPDGFFLTIGSGDTSSDSGNYGVTTWFWGNSLANLPDTSVTNFQILVNRAAFQRNIDSITLDLGPVAAVPEPGSAALLLLGSAGMAGLRRRQVARA